MSNEQQPNPQQVRQAEYSNLRMTTLLETVSAQRTDALNQVANLTADKAVVEKALKDTLEANGALNNRIVHLTDTVATLERQVADLQAALAEAHAELRKPKEEVSAPTEVAIPLEATNGRKRGPASLE